MLKNEFWPRTRNSLIGRIYALCMHFNILGLWRDKTEVKVFTAWLTCLSHLETLIRGLYKKRLNLVENLKIMRSKLD
jgi:hypothetical protein